MSAASRGRRLDLIARFPWAAKRELGWQQRSIRRLKPVQGVLGLETVRVGIAGDARRVIAEHPDRCIVFEGIRVPAKGSLAFGFGINEVAWTKSGDGVQFRVFVDGEDGSRTVLLDHYIDPKARDEDRRWFDREIDFSRWSGESISVYFETGAGPAGDLDFDWAVWSEPRLRDASGGTAFNFYEMFHEARVYDEIEAQRIRCDEVSIGNDKRAVVFQHAESVVRYDGLAIDSAAHLRFGIAIHPGAWEKEGDGVDFEVWVVCRGARERVFQRYLDPKSVPADRAWFDESVSLAAFTGESLSLEFVTLAGPAGDESFDWALWSWPAVEFEARPLTAARAERTRFLLITIDTLRADHLGCYGNSVVRTPHLDGLAARGICFDRAWSQSNITIPSHLAILSGCLPHRHVLDNRRHSIPAGLETLPMAFQAAGLATFAATSVHILGPSWTQGLDRGVDRFDTVDQGRRMGERTAAAFEEWLSGHAADPFFAWIHLFDPHAPYEPVQRYDRAYLERIAGDRTSAALNLDDLPPFLEDVRKWLAGITDPRLPAAQYAAQVSYSDEVVGRILEALAIYGCADETVIAVTADHGECLGEHGVYYNHFGLFEEVVRVPLILALPPRWSRERGRPLMRRAWNLPGTWRRGEMVRKRRIASPVMTVDLLPTLLELAGIERSAPVDGSSLIPLVRGEGRMLDRFVVAEHTDLAQAMVISGPWKYVRSLSDLSYSPSYSIRRGEEAVYRLDRGFGEVRCDPREAAPVLDRLRAAADRIVSERAAAERATPLGMDAAMVAQLQALGYF